MPFVPKTLSLAAYNDDTGADLNTFLNSLFDLWPGPFPWNPGNLFRAGLVDQIKAAETEGQLVNPTCWLIDNATVTRLVDILLGYWNRQPVLNNPRPRTIRRDEAFIQFVRGYIDENSLEMRVPGFRCKTKRDDKPSTYELRDNAVYSFKDNDGAWDQDVVRQFLELLLAGAHFVVVHSAKDLGDNAALPNFFTEFSNMQGVGDAMHSHYSAILAINGKNYPELDLIKNEGNTLDNIEDDRDAVLLPVVLCDKTAHEKHNSFFQMEGWRPGESMFMKGVGYTYTHKVLLAGYRHGADFATHQKTIWNISTYGASLFSEKRGAPVFLAPKAWMRKSTCIYSGFEGPDKGHKWFDSTLVEGLPVNDEKEAKKQDV